MIDRLPEFIGNHPLLVGAFAVIVVLLVANELARMARGFKEIGPSQATQLINRENAVIIDVSSAKEFQEAHIINARNMPFDQLDPAARQLAKLKDSPVIVYCKTGQRTPRACSLLAKHGFGQVYALRGGLGAWRNEQLPTARGRG